MVQNRVRMNPGAGIVCGKIEFDSGFRRDIRKDDRVGIRTCLPETVTDQKTAVGIFQNQCGDQQIEGAFRDPFLRLGLRRGTDDGIGGVFFQMGADILGIDK